MLLAAAEPSKYSLNFTEYVFTSLLKVFLFKCCCKCLSESTWYQWRVKRLQRHQDAKAKLIDEVDIM